MKVEVQDLHFIYPQGEEAIRGMSFSIGSGEQVAIVGQNGSGKTTLVKHFNGLLQPTKGIVRIGDWDTREHSIAQLAKRVGFVFQNADEQLFCSTVHQEIIFGPSNLGYSKVRIQHLIEDALNLTELHGREQTNPYDLSPTWRKMVALASIITMDADVMIFDEPTTGQDAVSVNRIANIIRVLQERGKTVIVITHDIDFAAENLKRVIVMSQGRILLDGPVLEVINQDEILASTYVEPPQLTRLGKRLGFSEPVCNEDEFLNTYRQLISKSPIRIEK